MTVSQPDLRDWVAALAEALGVEPADVDTTAILDLARDAAHNVARPAAPVSAFILGLAVGRGADPGQALATASALAVNWEGSP